MTQNKGQDPFIDLILDEEEQLIEAALEQGQIDENSSLNLNETKKQLEDAARRYKQLHSTKPITLRINQLDLVKIKAKAKRHKIPYQTLLGSLLHDFAEGDKDLIVK